MSEKVLFLTQYLGLREKKPDLQIVYSVVGLRRVDWHPTG